jgi:hypothetical protein
MIMITHFSFLSSIFDNWFSLPADRRGSYLMCFYTELLTVLMVFLSSKRFYLSSERLVLAVRMALFLFMGLKLFLNASECCDLMSSLLSSTSLDARRMSFSPNFETWLIFPSKRWVKGILGSGSDATDDLFFLSPARGLFIVC